MPHGDWSFLMSLHPTPPQTAGWTLLAVCTAALILPLSFSGGAIATPAIGLDLGEHSQEREAHS